MRNEEHHAAEAIQQIFQPLTRRKIQMVGRLVQDQKIQVVIHNDTEFQPRQLPTGQDRERFKDILTLKLIGPQTIPRFFHIKRQSIEQGIQDTTIHIVKLNDLR